MVSLVSLFTYVLTSLLFLCTHNTVQAIAQWPKGGSTRFYEFKVQMLQVNKLCNTRSIVTINQMYPGPVVYAQEDDRVIVKLTMRHPTMPQFTDGPSYITQCPVQSGQTFTYEFTLIKQKGTLFWHAHFSWLRATVYGALIIYPKKGVPYPFKFPYEEHTVILGEYWQQDLVQLERSVMASGGGAPIADAYTINGHPGPNYNCSANDVYKINVVPGKTYMIRLIGALLNMESFFSIANHKLTIVEADGEYTKPFTTDRVMLGPGQTLNVLVTADQKIGRYSMAMGPYMSAQNVSFQNITSIAYFQYIGATPNSVAIPASLLPRFNDNLAVKTVMDGLKSLEIGQVPKEIDMNLFFTIGINVNKCGSKTPNQNCQGVNGGVMAASMNNNSFVRPNISLLQAYYNHINGHFTEDFPGSPLKFYDFVNGAPNSAPNNTGSTNGTRTKVIEYGSRVQLILQDTGTVTTENHPIHLHGYSFYVVGYGSGNYNPQIATFNLEDPPYMNTIGVPVGGWAAIRFVADNPGVWFMHCHLEIHLTWGLSVALIVKNGQGPMETLPHPPADLPRC
ncbi:putative laccase [Helianthus annuus]|nr:putative laccase [Helianthus annuus]